MDHTFSSTAHTSEPSHSLNIDQIKSLVLDKRRVHLDVCTPHSGAISTYAIPDELTFLLEYLIAVGVCRRVYVQCGIQVLQGSWRAY